MQCFKNARYTGKIYLPFLDSITFPILLYVTIILPVSRARTKEGMEGQGEVEIEDRKGTGAERGRKILYFSPLENKSQIPKIHHLDRISWLSCDCAQFQTHSSLLYFVKLAPRL